MAAAAADATTRADVDAGTVMMALHGVGAPTTAPTGEPRPTASSPSYWPDYAPNRQDPVLPAPVQMGRRGGSVVT